MNAQLLAHKAYSGSAAAIRSPRAMEYDLYARVTHGLRSAMADEGPAGFARQVQALHDNRKLWTAVAGLVADPQNALPADLRARLFYLAEFTDQHTAKVLSEGASADILIDINTAVMRGLQDTGGAA